MEKAKGSMEDGASRKRARLRRMRREHEGERVAGKEGWGAEPWDLFRRQDLHGGERENSL